MMKTWMTASVLAFSSAAASAQGVPTVDTQALLKEIQQYEQMLKDFGIQNEQLSSLIEQAEMLQEQIEQYEEMIALLSDPSAVVSMLLGPEYAALLEGDFDISMLGAVVQGMEGDWTGLSGGGSSDFADKIQSVFESAGTSQAQVEELAASDNPNARRNATATVSNAVTSAAAERAHEEAQMLKQRATVLVDEIPGLTSLKQSVDHNTRVTAELAIAMAALLDIESVQAVNGGLTGVTDAATLAELNKFFVLSGDPD